MSHESVINDEIGKVTTFLAILEEEILFARVYDAAQAVIDQKRPGEKVQEVLINTDSAKSIAEKFDVFKSPLQNAVDSQETQGDQSGPDQCPAPPLKYYVMIVSGPDNNNDTWPLMSYGPNQFDTVVGAYDMLQRVQDANPKARYYVLATSNTPPGA